MKELLSQVARYRLPGEIVLTARLWPARWHLVRADDPSFPSAAPERPARLHVRVQLLRIERPPTLPAYCVQS